MYDKRNHSIFMTKHIALYLLYLYKPTFTAMIKKILIGVDDSKYADAAAKYGFDLAETLNAHVGLVHIIEPMAATTTAGTTDTILGTPLQGLSAVDDIEILNAQNDASENIIENVSKKYGSSLEVTHFNEYGSTAEGIISCSQEFQADLIVLGTHSRSGFERFFTGSIAEHVVRHSEVPVLVVPSKD
jgi:nucleotide-binding universal stress UspA family protein